MLMVIFGAGASFDSDPRNSARIDPFSALERMPLAQHLFEKRSEFNFASSAFPS